jgi:hypothetical protein
MALSSMQKRVPVFLLCGVTHFGNHCVHLLHVSIGAFLWRTVGGG